MPIVGGLDIHRKQITFDYLDTGTGQVRRGQISPADRVHLRAWLARFAGRDDVAFALEACTGWRYIAEELAAVGVAAHLAEPADTAFARGRKRHAKTDKTDCRHLRMLLAEGRLPECWIPPGHILEARALRRISHVGNIPSVTTRDRHSRHRAVRDAETAQGAVTADQDPARAEKVTAVLIKRCRTVLTERSSGAGSVRFVVGGRVGICPGKAGPCCRAPDTQSGQCASVPRRGSAPGRGSRGARC